MGEIERDAQEMSESWIWRRSPTLFFYNGCSLEVKRLLDVLVGESLLNKGHEAAIRVIEDMATTSYEWPGERQVQILKKVASTSEADPLSLIVAQLSAINTKIENMSQSKHEPELRPQPQMGDVNFVHQGGQ
ncbi:hypothetical protein C2S51_006924 [Perilla frutescens var. frutescens]|nr:hypothetical protein C2S51_006924 [Perilla frutescens var. frutescens]